MTALELLKALGEGKTEVLAIRAGTTLAYYKQIAYRHRRPSADLAKRLAAESNGMLDAAELVLVDLKEPTGERHVTAPAAPTRDAGNEIDPDQITGLGLGAAA